MTVDWATHHLPSVLFFLEMESLILTIVVGGIALWVLEVVAHTIVVWG